MSPRRTSMRPSPAPVPGMASWRRPRTILVAALVAWLLVLVVRTGRIVFGDGHRDLAAVACGTLLLIGLLIFSVYLTGVFFQLLAGIWRKRFEERRVIPTGDERGGMAVVVGVIVEGFCYWFLFLSALGVVTVAGLLGILAWSGTTGSGGM
jgi:hypothetical protein